MVCCSIEKSVYGGAGLARVDGMVVFVSGAFAGEKVQAEIVATKKRFAEARATAVIDSPYRPAGPVADVPVPGMVYAPIPYERETAFKLAQLKEFLARLGIDAEPRLEPAAMPLHYRNKAVYHCADGRLGYRREKSHDVVDILSDPLVCGEIDAVLGVIRNEAPSAFAAAMRQSGKSRAARGCGDSLTVRFTPADGVKWWVGAAPRDLMLRERTRQLEFEAPADGFYQVNPEVGERLVAAAVDAYLEAPGDILDLYCGVGVFGLCCLDAFRKSAGEALPSLVGVESGRGAVAAAKRNAAAAGIPARFFCERTGGSLARLKARGKTVIVDPPRGGMETGVADWLAKSAAARIIAVSCDPATFARDLEPLLAAYQVDRITLFDMFPRTARFETLAVLSPRR